MQIIPAILPKSYEEIEEKLSIAAGYATMVQIDICDGGYTPSRTWPYLKGPGVEDTIFNEIVAQERPLPHWEDIDFEFDLMIKGAYAKIPDFISAGASRIIVHKASVSADELASIVRDYGKHSEELGVFDIALGIALLPSDSPESIREIVDKVHFVQVMGSERIGFQGEHLSDKAVELIKSLRQAYPNLSISIDIGVNLDTAPQLRDAGVDSLVVGSALFESGNFLATIEEFKAL